MPSIYEWHPRREIYGQAETQGDALTLTPAGHTARQKCKVVICHSANKNCLEAGLVKPAAVAWLIGRALSRSWSPSPCVWEAFHTEAGDLLEV